MDTLKPAALLLVASVADGGFLSHLLQGAADAGMPHTVTDLAAILGGALYIAGSQLFQRIANRRQLKNDLADALAAHGITTPGTPGPSADGV